MPPVAPQQPSADVIIAPAVAPAPAPVEVEPIPDPPRIAVRQHVRTNGATEASGKLLTRAQQGVVDVLLTDDPPFVGAYADLTRQIDAAVPYAGGMWAVIARTEVTQVVGNRVTLKTLEERAVMIVRGLKVDHFTVDTPIRLTWTTTADASH